MSEFEEFGVMPELIKAVEELGWELPTAIQAECIPLILGGGDVMAAAETGSGKTGAFALPVIQLAYETLAGTAQTTVKPKQKVSVQGMGLNPDDRDLRFAISEDGLTGQSRAEQNWCGARATVGVIKGKHYYEAYCTDEGLCRVGWSTKAASYDLGTDAGGFGYGGTGKASNRKQFNEYGGPYTMGDTIGCCIDCDEGEISFTKNGRNLGVAFKISPQQRGFAFYPAVVLKNAEMNFNFGSTPFKNLPPGYKGIAQATGEETKVVTEDVTGKKGRNPLILILEPTRELAEQTHEQIMLFKKYLPPPTIEAALIVGGDDVQKSIKQLKNGVDIITATPGRLKDFVQTGKVDLSEVRYFVLDEADRLLNPETIADVKRFYEQIPKTTRRLQVLMFSATLHSPEIKNVSEEICKFPTWVDLKGKDSVPETVYHAAVLVDPSKTDIWLRTPAGFKTDGVHAKDRAKKNTNDLDAVSYSEGIKLLKPQLLLRIIDAHKMDQALIFVRTRLDADNLQKYLSGLSGQGKQRGMLQEEYSCLVMHSGAGSDRTKNLDKFKTGEVRFLICTDLAARGLDIKELPYVINYTLPDKPEDYIHRVGRVGRAERMGLAISLVGAGREKVWYHTCKSRGPPCTETSLVEQGGCCIWYNEPEFRKQIEERLHEEFTLLDARFQLPGITDGSIVFGEKKQDARGIVRDHVEQLRPAVEELAQLEKQVQLNWWDLRNRFKNPGKEQRS